jgi:hypothetical protein
MKRSWAFAGSALALLALACASYQWASTGTDAGPAATVGEAAPVSRAAQPTPSTSPSQAQARQTAVAQEEDAVLRLTGAPSTHPSIGEVSASSPRIADAFVAKVHDRLSERTKTAESNVANGGQLTASQKDGLAVDKAVLKLIEAQRYWYLGPAEQTPAYLHLNTRSTRFWSTSTKDGRVMVLEMTSYEFPEVFENDPRTW